MDQHPIPQDVTGFQFKLIGTMTVKQFGYVALGAILAVLSWYAPVNGFLWHLVTKGILVPVFGLSGVIIAFIPIEGRPVDVMATNFFHALFSPNQYIYIKKGRKFSFTQISYTKAEPTKITAQKSTSQVIQENKKEQQLRALLASSYQNTKNNLDKKELAFLQSVTTIPAPTLQAAPQATHTQINSVHLQNAALHPAPKPTALHFPALNPQLAKAPPSPRTPSIANQDVQLQQLAAETKQLESKQKKALEPPRQMQSLHTEKDRLVQDLTKLKVQLPAQRSTVASTSIPQQRAGKQTPARNIPQNMTKSEGFPHVSDTPNVIVGIVKDSRGNTLPNILVEVKDKDGNPVRAFKTNPLGQFASATPLADGTYAIELEDPKKQHGFDTIQISANKQIMLPIEIISHDAREDLRKQLFN